MAVSKFSLRNLKKMPFQQMHGIMKIARETAKNSKATKNDRDLYQHHATGCHYSSSGKQSNSLPDGMHLDEICIRINLPK